MMEKSGKTHRAPVPKRRQRHYPYDESLDEAAQLIADESVEVERETPTEDNEPVEGAEANEPPELPAFEE